MIPKTTHPHLMFDSLSFDTHTQRNQGFFQFQNGWSVSVVYGNFLYSSPIPSVGRDFPTKFKNDECPAASAEVAIFAPNGEFIPFMDGESVKGWVTPDELIDILSWVKSQTNSNPKSEN
jgi:hypothetical protein